MICNYDALRCVTLVLGVVGFVLTRSFWLGVSTLLVWMWLNFIARYCETFEREARRRDDEL